MTRSSIARALALFLMVTLGIITMLACGGGEEASVLQPDDLVGTWEDTIDKGRMVLSANGTYRYVNASTGPPGIVEGEGQWEAESGGILIKLLTGQSTNFEYTLQSPTEMRWAYSVSTGTLKLIELTGMRKTATYTKVGN